MTGPSPLTRRLVIGGAAAAVVAATAPSPAQASGCRIDQSAIDSAAADLEGELIALRRDLHANPEDSGAEVYTSGVVAQLLTDAGLEVTTRVGGHGVVGVLKGARSGRTVAYRADMDATYGENGLEHLCGHDLHTTIGIGVAQVLAGLRDRLIGTVVFLFQPAEESLEGAKAMIAAGALDWTGAEEIHGIHCGPLPFGVIAVTPGSGLPGLDRGGVVLTGPDSIGRAERLAAELATLGTVAVPATSADMQQIVDDVQIPDGPLAEFVFMRTRLGENASEERAEVLVSFRCWPEERYTEIREEVARISESYGEAQVSFATNPFPAMVCPEWEAHKLKRHLRRAMGAATTTVMHAAFPFNGEDFALFLDEVPGTFSFLGVQAPGTDIATAAPHFPTFDPDERAIDHGVRAMAGWLAERASR